MWKKLIACAMAAFMAMAPQTIYAEPAENDDNQKNASKDTGNDMLFYVAGVKDGSLTIEYMDRDNHSIHYNIEYPYDASTGEIEINGFKAKVDEIFNPKIEVKHTGTVFTTAGSIGDLNSMPDFNSGAYSDSSKNVYYPGYTGQCTWFVAGRFYELYGYKAGFTGNGSECAGQLVRTYPDKFELSTSPAPGAIFSCTRFNHVGVVVGFDGQNITIQEGNINGLNDIYGARHPMNLAVNDWHTKTQPFGEFMAYTGAVFAVPKAGTFTPK